VPKITKHPRLRTLVRKMASGEAHTYYAYDMRPDGKPDIQLGKDHKGWRWRSGTSCTTKSRG
jgi:hypothetical protein